MKNVLVFVPLAAAHETDAGLYLVAAGMFAALSAVASGTYVLNDLLDLPHDRRHATKRHRPMAAGKVPLLPMIGIGAALAAGGLLLAFWLSVAAGFWVLLYVAVTPKRASWSCRTGGRYSTWNLACPLTRPRSTH